MLTWMSHRIKQRGLALALSLISVMVSSFAYADTTTASSSNASTIDWDAYKGKVVYIDFWASWCGPCKASFPWMNAMQRKYADKGLVIVAINVDQDPRKAAEFLVKNPANFSVKYDPDGKLATQFAVKTMPSSFVLDRSGKPAFKHMGFTASKASQYEQELQQLLR